MFFHAFVVLDYWVFQPLAYKECMPSACCVVASVIVVVTMYVCMPSVAMLLGTIGRASFVFTSTSFGGGGVCYGLISAQNKLNGNTENECFCSTLCVTLSAKMTP